MQLQIQGTQLDLTPAIKKYIEDKIGGLSRYVKRYEEQGEILARVEIARTTQHHLKGDVFYAEVLIHLPGKTIRVEEINEDVRAAIDAVKDQLKVKLVDVKEKMISARRRGKNK